MKWLCVIFGHKFGEWHDRLTGKGKVLSETKDSITIEWVAKIGRFTYQKKEIEPMLMEWTDEPCHRKKEE